MFFYLLKHLAPHPWGFLFVGGWVDLYMNRYITILLFICVAFWGCEEEQPKDCAGNIGGIAVEDNCGNCDDDISNDCVEDCAGIWGGNNICGCTDSTASNFNSNATFDDGSCDTSQSLITFVKDVSPDNDCGYEVAVKPTEEGGYIIAGCKNDSAWLMKTDLFGNKEWEHTYGLVDYWGNRSVFQTNDGGYLFAGWTGIVKVDTNGTKEWIKKGVQGNNGQYPYYEDIIEHSNGNYYAVGGPVTPTDNTNNGGQAILVKLNQSGSILKTKFYGGQCEDDLFRSVIESNDGKLLIVGEKGHGNQSYPCSFDFRYYKDAWILKTGLNGGVIWENTYGGDYLEKGADIVKKETGGYMMVGEKCSHNYDIYSCGSKAKVMILNIDEDGNSMDQTILSGLYFFEGGSPISITNTTEGGFIFVAKPKNGGYTWLYKWGDFEGVIDKKVSDAGFGGENVERTLDDGFIISTAGNILIKTDSYLSY